MRRSTPIYSVISLTKVMRVMLLFCLCRANNLQVRNLAYAAHVQYLLEPAMNYIDASIETIGLIHKYEPTGDILVFQPTRKNVDAIVQTINDGRDQSIYAIPLYPGLPMNDQLKAIEKPPKGLRKVVVATSIAETSVTIDGISFVIDPGLTQIKTFDPKSGLESIIVAKISKASAIQRAGRAGRTRPGKVFRLYTESTYNQLDENTVPEMQRSNLAAAMLQLKALGIENVIRFEYLSPPPAKLVTHALELLYSLKALDDYGRLTRPFGTWISEAPIDPMISTMLLSSEAFGCVEEALTIAAMLTVANVYYTPKHRHKKDIERERAKFAVEEGDHITLLNGILYQTPSLQRLHSSQPV